MRVTPRGVRGAVVGLGALAAGLGWLGASPAQADPIVSNLQETQAGNRSLSASYKSATNVRGGGQLSQLFTTDAMSYMIGNLTAGYTLSGPPAPLTAALYTDDAGAPGALLTQFTRFGSQGFSPLNTGVVLAPNTSYWFALGLNPGNLTVPSTTQLSWAYEGSNAATGPGTVGAGASDTPAGSSTWPSLSFLIGVNGTPAGSGSPSVPEIDPGSLSGGLTLLVAGLLALTGRRRPTGPIWPLTPAAPARPSPP
jgi:MYXO-CTERM domain-containing protein